ncbi:MAG TPA: ATP-binding cassette domain-containing protein, partial [Bacteroidales bacterium]|nr:ATP-binding cassette domain-containing protein [Bacteroidales bacterium]
MAQPLLSIRDLTVSFPSEQGPHEAVKEVSLDLGRGASLGIVGESGSGKSLTALSILNLLPSASRVDGGSIRYFPEEAPP